jgi:hypothetical protein
MVSNCSIIVVLILSVTSLVLPNPDNHSIGMPCGFKVGLICLLGFFYVIGVVCDVSCLLHLLTRIVITPTIIWDVGMRSWRHDDLTHLVGH